jgi:hypothetical protein
MTRDVQDTLLRQLKQPFDPKFVKWRVGATNKDKTKGIALAYIDSREVQKRLDDVCGVGGWQSRYIPVDGGFICELDILIDDRWVTKSNTAGYSNMDPIKGGGSDALKRAASAWGVGRYLYYLPNVWVEIKPQGKSYALAEIPELPDWAKPGADIERWEDVAELQADITSGADYDTTDGVVLEDDEVASLVAKATSRKDFGELLKSLTPEQKQRATPLINQRIKEIANVQAN